MMLIAIGQAGSLLTYPGKGAFSFIGSGHMDVYSDVFYQLSEGNVSVVANHSYTNDFNDLGIVNTKHDYQINERVATEQVYRDFTSSLSSGKTIDHNSLDLIPKKATPLFFILK